VSAPPETPAALHGKRAGIKTALDAALLAGNPIQKLRSQIADIDRPLPSIAQSDAVAAEAAQQVADAKIEAAGQATAAAIHERRAAVMAAFEIRDAEPMIRDQTIDDAAMDLARCDADLAEANAILNTAQAHEARITGQIHALEGERQAIVTRRAAGDQHPTDGAKLAELVADKEGLELMSPEAKAGLDEARRGVTECNTARRELSRNSAAPRAPHWQLLAAIASMNSPRSCWHPHAGYGAAEADARTARLGCAAGIAP
jgi:hypothetical protein